MASNDVGHYTRTRDDLHAVAEHVVSAALHAATGKIGLRALAGGFGTPRFGPVGEERQLAVVGTTLVVRWPEGERQTPLTTLREAAAFAPVDPGAPVDVYTPTTTLDLDRPLSIDPTEARRLADWFALVDEALNGLRREFERDDPTIAQLWPEHFDLGLSLDGVNYGGSPGDASEPMPYLYVGPWKPRSGPFWNRPYGAGRTRSEVGSPDEALAFFLEGHELAAATR